MRYWYKLSEVEMWKQAYLDGVDDPERPPLYEETAEILEDFRNPLSDWWPLRRRDSFWDEDEIFEFNSKNEAEGNFCAKIAKEL